MNERSANSCLLSDTNNQESSCINERILCFLTLSLLVGVYLSRTRGGAVAARRAHNPKVVGSNPTPATNFQLQIPSKSILKPSPIQHNVFTDSSFKVFTNSPQA